MPRAYDRTRHYLKMGDYVKLIGFKGEKVFFKVALAEPVGPLVSLRCVQTSFPPSRPQDSVWVAG